MAIFQYGTIVTRISGSIGGTTFRLFRGMPVIYNKPQGGSKSKLLKNARLNSLAFLFRYFSTLATTEQELWQVESENYLFPNKFGTPRNLSGREFFIKCNAQLLPVNAFQSTAADFNGDIAIGTISTFTFSVTDSVSDIFLTTTGIPNYYLFQFEVSSSHLNSPTFTRRKILFTTLESTDFHCNVYNEVIATFPYLQVGWKLRVYYCSMAMYGLRSIWRSVDIEVT